ncbi:MAG: family 10 glycosylhydrolase, partial [Gemmatimonadetes bacterium]|nr:family 10 glycosylhydrolase [Gemmatimonadota bacterium]
ASQLEPWSEYLTGEQGKAPEPFYDPLAFAVREAHRRGLELHAWFNPYRARHPSAKSPLAPTHLGRTHPELVKPYGGNLWMDPGEDSVRAFSTRVVMDVVRRYDVDGVHIDDYFYPYRERDAQGREIPFPDSASWERYVRSGGRLSRDDWRRSNVDRFVEGVYRAVKKEKPWVKFGISPFGSWRPGNPRQVTGFDAYEQLYADSRKWLVNGWLDYFTPQLYWQISRTGLSYPVLLRWWTEQNVMGRHMWPGNFTGQTLPTEAHWPASEIIGQIYVTRGIPGATGNVHFSMRSLMQDPDSLSTRLMRETYAEPALIPASPWLGRAHPARPGVTLRRDASGGTVLALEPAGRVPAAWWVVQSRYAAGWRTEILPGELRSYPLPADSTGAAPRVVSVYGVDRNGNEGPAATARP